MISPLSARYRLRKACAPSSEFPEKCSETSLAGAPLSPPSEGARTRKRAPCSDGKNNEKKKTMTKDNTEPRGRQCFFFPSCFILVSVVTLPFSSLTSLVFCFVFFPLCLSLLWFHNNKAVFFCSLSPERNGGKKIISQIFFTSRRPSLSLSLSF